MSGSGGLHALPPLPEDDGDDGDATFETLRRRMAPVCVAAVDSFEVAAGLEAEGINDEGARGHGYPDVFELAEDLYVRTVRRPPLPRPPADPWRGPVWRHLLRGVLFGLPGLCYALAAPMLARPFEGLVLMVSLLLAWPLSQGVAYLAYVRLGRGDRAGAERALRSGLIYGVALVAPLIVLAGVLLGAGATATALGIAQSVYLFAATVALVTTSEPWLLLALTPGALVSVFWLVFGTGSVPVLGWLGWLATLTCTVVLALIRTSSKGPPPAPVLTWADVRAAAPYAAFGLLAGGLLVFATVPVQLGHARPAGAVAVALIALSLSMGVAEWILCVYRARAQRLLHCHARLSRFAWAARHALGDAFACYLAALLGLTVLVASTAGLAGSAWLAEPPGSPPTLRVLGGYLGLGGAFFVALLLQSCGRIGAVLLACSAALAAETVALLVTDPWTAQLSTVGGLLGVLLIYAFAVLGRTGAHR